MHPRLAVTAVLVALPHIAAAGPVRVAVVPGAAVNLDVARVDALSQDLAEALRSVLDVDAVGGLEVRRRLPAAGLPADCVATEACVADVAHRLDAEQLLFVVMVDTGARGAIQVDSTWIDPATHQSASRPTIDLAAVGSARSVFTAAARQLLPDAPVRPSPAVGDPASLPAPGPRHLTPPAYATAGVTALGLGVGISLGLTARSRYNDCDGRAGGSSPCSSTRKDSIRTLALVADAGWLVAIGGTIATAVLYSTSRETRVIVEPAPGGVAVAAVGRF